MVFTLISLKKKKKKAVKIVRLLGDHNSLMGARQSNVKIIV